MGAAIDTAYSFEAALVLGEEEAAGAAEDEEGEDSAGVARPSSIALSQANSSLNLSRRHVSRGTDSKAALI
jgi:hypothetical protein